MCMNIRIMFLLFIIYSFLGWLMEVVISLSKEKKIINRGFLIGPICPIYGAGALSITLLLTKYYNDIPVLFILAAILGSSLEYFTSYIMEKTFKTRWWDYSTHKYNINGRISLITSLGFGALGVVLIHFLNPFFTSILNTFPPIIITILTIIIAVIFITDFIISFNIISNIKKVDLSGAKDTTEEITIKVRETLKNKSLLNKRLIEAFPHLKIKIKNRLKK